MESGMIVLPIELAFLPQRAHQAGYFAWNSRTQESNSGKIETAQ
jgi:hypothetical protein